MSVSCGGLIVSPEELARIREACRQRDAEFGYPLAPMEKRR